jgi:hypothetical protein
MPKPAHAHPEKLGLYEKAGRDEPESRAERRNRPLHFSKWRMSATSAKTANWRFAFRRNLGKSS